MGTNRRDFIKTVGIALASLVLLRCVPPGRLDDSGRGRLRRVWLRLGWLAEQSTGDWERGQRASEELLAEHQAALDEIVAAGETTSVVAAELQAAFGAAVYHVYRSNAPITCYEPVLIDYMPVSSSQLTQQVQILDDMAEDGNLDPATIAQAQAAIGRDIAFLSLSQEDVQALYDHLIQTAGGAGYPSFDELALEVPPAAAEAARFLIEVLVEEE
jgi:hypothetical protein